MAEMIAKVSKLSGGDMRVFVEMMFTILFILTEFAARILFVNFLMDNEKFIHRFNVYE